LTQNRLIESTSPSFRHLPAPQYRFFSQKVTDEPSSAPPATDKINILGSLKGIGIADDVLKKPNEGNNEEQVKSVLDEDDEEKRRKEDEASWRTLKYSMIFMGVTTAGLAGFLVGSWGAPDIDEDGNVVYDQFSDKQIVIQYLMRSWNAVMNYSQMIRDPSRDKLLPDPLKEPYIQPPYTLVLEMTGVLVHPDWTYQTGWRFKKRPGIDFFLSQVGPPTFEVVIYTAEQAFTAFPIIDALDPNGYIMYRLFRDATRYEDGHHIKDLDCINRDLSKVIVIDWNEKSVKSHQRNALKLKEWKGNDDDRFLVDLALLLKSILFV